jgi:predicted lipoprotein with Yx(FWY)xxD motif
MVCSPLWLSVVVMRTTIALLIAVTAVLALPAEGMAAKKGKRIKADDSRYGSVLFDGKGRAIYLFTKDEGEGKSRCYGDCARAWPPVLTRGKPRAGAGVKAGKLGTTKRRSGKRQVTYNGHPLYYYISDTEPGEITCQDVDEFGGIWYVVAPSGRAVL